MEIRHAQLFRGRFDFALIPNVGLGELMLEEAFVVIPRLLRGAFGQAREIFRILDGLSAATLRDFG